MGSRTGFRLISDRGCLPVVLSTFFITMTCNPEWPESQSQLRPGQNFTDIPIVVVRVLKRKLALLEKALKTMFPNADTQLYFIHSVEFQKRGFLMSTFWSSMPWTALIQPTLTESFRPRSPMIRLTPRWSENL